MSGLRRIAIPGLSQHNSRQEQKDGEEDKELSDFPAPVFFVHGGTS